MEDRDAFDEMADVELVVPCGRRLKAVSAVLQLASPVIRDALRCQPHSGDKRRRDDDQLPSIPVEGSFEAWALILQMLHEPGKVSCLTSSKAFQLFPVAHKYNIATFLESCTHIIMQSRPYVRFTTTSEAPASDAAHPEPSLFDWLVLADHSQYEPLLEVCMSQLKQKPPSVIKSALACPAHRKQLEQCRLGTLMQLMNHGWDLPFEFQGIRIPDPASSAPIRRTVVPYELHYHSVGCLLGRKLVLGCELTTCYLLDIENGTDDDEPLALMHALTPTAIQPCRANTAGAQHQVLVLQDRSIELLDVESPTPWETRMRVVDFEANLSATTMAVWPDGVAVTHHEGAIDLWDMPAGSCTPLAEKAHAQSVTSLATPADSPHLLLSASHDCSVKLWDVRAKLCVRTMTGHSQVVNTVAVDDAAKTVVSGSNDGTAKIWDLGSGQCVGTFDGWEGPVRRLFVHPSGTMALGCSNNMVRAWDPVSNAEVANHRWAGMVADLFPAQDFSKMAVLRRGAELHGDFNVTVWGA